MYEAYFTRRLLEVLALADQASNADERCIHLRASRYYRDLLEWPERRRSVRHAVRIGGSVHHLSTSARPVVVSDLSNHGFQIEIDEQVKPGTLIALQLGGLAPLEAYVVWQKGTCAGCKFLADLHPALLEAAMAVSPRLQ